LEEEEEELICGLYRPPSLCDNIFIEDLNKTFDKISTKYDNIIIIGDLNYNYLDGFIIKIFITSVPYKFLFDFWYITF
jgi:hypothetical protein